MARSCLLYNELHYNGLMTDLGLSPSSSSPHHVPLVSVTMLLPTLRQDAHTFVQLPTSHRCLRLSPSDLRSKNVRDIPENLQRFSEKVQRFSENLPRFWEKLRCLEEKLQLPSPHLPLFLTSISPITAPCFLLPHASVGTFHPAPKGLTLPPALFINISTQSAFLSRFSYTRTRVNRSLLLFSFTTFTDTPYNPL